MNDAPDSRRSAARRAAAAIFRFALRAAACGAVVACASGPDRATPRPAPAPPEATASDGDLLAAPPDAGAPAPASRPRRDAMLSDLLDERR